MTERDGVRDDANRLSRRACLRAALVATAVGTAGCEESLVAGGEDDPADPTGDQADLGGGDQPTPGGGPTDGGPAAGYGAGGFGRAGFGVAGE